MVVHVDVDGGVLVLEGFGFNLSLRFKGLSMSCAGSGVVGGNKGGA